MNQLYLIDTSYINSIVDKEKYPDLYAYSKLAVRGLVDRTDTFTMPLNFVNLVPITKFHNHSVDYFDLCNQRAKEIAAVNKPIYLLWSGGIDSTTVVTAFLKNCHNDQITVLLSQHSIYENPNFFNQNILGKIKYESSLDLTDRIFNESCVLIDGEQCHLYGNYQFHNSVIKDDPTPLMYYASRFPYPSTAQQFIQNLCKVSAESVGIELANNTHYLWWWIFNFNHHGQSKQQVLMYYPELVSNLPKQNNIINFFNTESFNQWAMFKVLNTVRKPGEYKKESKDYIFDFTNNQQIYSVKKIDSGSRLNTMRKKIKIVDSNFCAVDDDQLIDYYQKENCFNDLVQMMGDDQ